MIGGEGECVGGGSCKMHVFVGLSVAVRCSKLPYRISVNIREFDQFMKSGHSLFIFCLSLRQYS